MKLVGCNKHSALLIESLLRNNFAIFIFAEAISECA